MPTVIREFARASAGEVGGVAAGVFSSGELLTAVQNGSDALELILWRPDADALTLHTADRQRHASREVGEIALAMMGQRCLTAVQNADGYLLLIPWALEPDGTLSRLEYADHQAGKASYLTVAALTDSLAVTGRPEPLREPAPDPLVVDATTGHVSRLNTDSAQGGAVGYLSPQPPNLPVLEGPLIATAALDESSVFTAKVDAGGELELATWELSRTRSRWFLGGGATSASRGLSVRRAARRSRAGARVRRRISGRCRPGTTLRRSRSSASSS